jgi:site-specific recombinase XerD
MRYIIDDFINILTSCEETKTNNCSVYKISLDKVSEWLEYRKDNLKECLKLNF